MLNVSHEKYLIFVRMNIQVTFIFIPIVSHKDSFCQRGKSKLGLGLFIHELLMEPLISRKISGLLRSLSVGTLICRVGLIKYMPIISSFTRLCNSGRRGQGRVNLWKQNLDGQLSSSKSSDKLKSGKESEGRPRTLDRFKSYKSGSS